MSSIAVLGAGAGGAAATVQLIQAGHRVSLWSRSTETIAPFQDSGGVSFEGALGEGTVAPQRTTNDLDEALHDSELVVVCLPAVAHEGLARSLASLGCETPIVLNPGGTGGALVFRKAFQDAARPVPPLAELSTLTYIARKTEPAKVSVFTVAKRIHAACLPGGEAALDAFAALFEGVRREPNVLSTSLRNINLVLHPPAALLSAAWVEATGGDFFFYSEAVTPGVFRLMEGLDDERRAVGAAFHLDLPSLIDEMMEVGSVDRAAVDGGRLREAIALGRANRNIKAPDSLEHRYYREDLPYALLPFVELGRVGGTPTPVADAILTLASAVLDFDIRARGLTASRLGIEGLDSGGLLEIVEGRRS